jgi:hypothetical protein
MKVAFSFTNRLRLGQAKGGLGFKGQVTKKQVNRYTCCITVYLFTYVRAYLST